MSEEEKQAIEYIKFKTIAGLETLQLEKDVKAIEIALNLIDKLQKENEELTNELSKIQCDNRQMKDNSISKDKIREVLKDIYFYYGQNNDMFLVDKIRKELLGE